MARFSSIDGYRNVINSSDRLYGQSSTPKCLHQQGSITARLIYIQRKVKPTNGKENVMIHKYQVYIFPKGKQSKIYMTKFALAGSQRRLSMITQITEGARMVFLVINSIDTWENTKC